MSNRYKIITVELETEELLEAFIVLDNRSIGFVLMEQIRASGGAEAFGVESETAAWFRRDGCHISLLREDDARFNIDIACKMMSKLRGSLPGGFISELTGGASGPGSTAAPKPPADTTPLKLTGIPHRGMGGRLYTDATSGPPVFNAPCLPPLGTADAAARDALIDRWFRQLQNVLRALKRRHPTLEASLPGGGSVPIPDWFLDWCQEQGIRIRFHEG